MRTCQKNEIHWQCRDGVPCQTSGSKDWTNTGLVPFCLARDRTCFVLWLLSVALTVKHLFLALIATRLLAQHFVRTRIPASLAAHHLVNALATIQLLTHHFVNSRVIRHFTTPIV